ncbi:hypothetical protein A8M60_15440 [Nocardia farcinica]|nr:hypothetical protein A8M60_15440 [Nocardia farcinica]
MDDTAVNLFGLGSPLLQRALGLYAGVHVAVTVAACWTIRTSTTWFALAAGFAMMVSAAILLMRYRRSKLPIAQAALVTVLGVGGLGISLVSLPRDTYMTIQTTPVTSALAIILVLVALHGRPVVAWLGAACGTALAALGGAVTGISPGVGASSTVYWYPVLMIATLFALMATPMPERIRNIREQAFARAAEKAAADAAAVEHDRQMRGLDARARPILERIADGDDFAPADVVDARLTEAQLRDAIRAPAWDCDEVRDLVWTARRHGVSVRLLDDGVLDESDRAIGHVRAVLVEVLNSIEPGPATVTARILPPGRTFLSSVVINAGSWSRRVDIGHDGVVAATDHSDQATEPVEMRLQS